MMFSRHWKQILDIGRVVFHPLPVALLMGLLGIVSSFIQHGFLIGARRGIPLAGPGVHVSIWYLLLLGLGAGYVTALIGQASGIVTLPYSMTILGFSNVHVSPTIQLETFLSPFGALLGYRKEGQWNSDFALLLSCGGTVGALLGPFVRTIWLFDAPRFKAALGTVMIYIGVSLSLRRRPSKRQDGHPGLFSRWPSAEDRAGKQVGCVGAANRSAQPQIVTLEKDLRYIRIGFLLEEWRMSVPKLGGLGCLVGIIASMLGVGGGFLLVPILVATYDLPMYVVVAGSMLFAMATSAVSLISYNLIIPLLISHSASSEWAWGFFTGSAAIIGSWWGARSQKHWSEPLLKLVLGVLTGGTGLLYLLSYLKVFPIHM